ncbi:hypothetical protein AXF42_Ash009327 [Apostasia shenzhenica]|uniref:Uncharacterized protein n=1 Tax=Apostasia shenzhenica TaxID=1088818 RepID=A0A2I0B3S5_9ASPA|nr:hypothetical protein AXF42_Ash009327 [Apostasia shenzhenica]
MVVEIEEARMKKEEEKEDYGEEEVMAMEDKLQEKVTQEENMKQMKRGRKKKKSDCKLLSYEELPEYMKENEFIRRYYRSERPISHAFLSLFSWHNETLNVWT